MVHLLFSVLSSTAILIIFKGLARLKIDVFHVIIINYAMAFTLGLFLNKGTQGLSGLASGRIPLSHLSWSPPPWIYFSMAMGVCLIAMFFIIALSTQRAGITVTTIFSKISVVIPMLFSIFYYNEALTPIKALGMVMALGALVLTTLKRQDAILERHGLCLPFALFIGMGVLDATVKFVQQTYLTPADSAGFTGASFFFAFVSGVIVCLIQRVPVHGFMEKKTLCAGILLGACNFGSMFFLINALDSMVFDSSMVFGINSISIVGLSILFAGILFKERLSCLNFAGVVLSITAIALFIHA